MIDKNDVKMPVQKGNMKNLLADNSKRMQVEKLLELVNDAENRQELRLKSDYYSRFHWFGNSATKSSSSYFSYQEEAVYDFIFNLNKSGILSDQVGMGKTIEAGMIISELASRNELRSLLIIVPNEIMAQKWEYELKEKFGVKEHVIEATADNEVEQVYPAVKTLKHYDDFCRCVYDCIAYENFGDLNDEKFEHFYAPEDGVEEPLEDIVKRFIKEDINKAVDMVNEGLADEYDVTLSFDGKQFTIVGTKFKRAYEYDQSGAIAKFLNGRQNQRQLETYVNAARFKSQYTKLIKGELNAFYTLLGDYFTTIPEIISTISSSMTEKYPILVAPIAYSKYDGEKVELEQFLNRSLLPKIENYAHKYNVKEMEDGKEKIAVKYEGYRIIDFFIDVAYQTIIVDEVHDYIDVCAKMERKTYHAHAGYNAYPSSVYDRYELFDDYYFIKKSSLYKKLKDLADKANRKIFLTATPIKSDMVDFYLLTLLASNKDAEAYEKTRKNLMQGFTDGESRERAIEDLYRAFLDCIDDAEGTAHFFAGFSSRFFVFEKDDNGEDIKGRYRYPYFNNSFLKENFHNEKLIKDYLESQISYMSVEEVIMELILSYSAEMIAEGRSLPGIVNLMKNLQVLMEKQASEFQTRVIFRALFENNLKLRFEEDFTKNGKPIKRIRELLESEDGARMWHKMYGKYGIRHTRHQTYNLSKCAQLDKLSANKMERYQNLPIWPRRDGKVIFLMRDDIFFDCFLNVRRERQSWSNGDIRVEDLPNYELLSGSKEDKQERFDNALAIFNYINNSMSGGDEVYHEPKGIKYDSVDLDDSKVIDYKLALVNKLMTGEDRALGAVSRKVLLFVEEGREKIAEWFRYQRCKPLYKGEELDKEKLFEYERKWANYDVRDIAGDWKVSEDAEALSSEEGNVLIIIDPKRYEKGVDLQKADTIINFDINYCPLKMEQRIGRIDRIRPSSQNQQINIISFVLLNDMSGFIINFFANELKMFTQWMGETTGIVSVPEEEGFINAQQGEDVSFEGKVYELEKYYKAIYNLCNQDMSDAEVKEMAKAFKNRFGASEVSEIEAQLDFAFLKELRESFDTAFKNSVSPQRSGYNVIGHNTTKVMRFNSTLSPFQPCAATTCANCSNKATCKVSNKKVRNVYPEFVNAVNNFFEKGAAYYEKERINYQHGDSILSAAGNDKGKLSAMLIEREEFFKQKYKEVQALLPKVSEQAFTIPYDTYRRIFLPMKRLYWDAVVSKYINLILRQYYKQCDSVLQGAALFERFIKTLSIADFMNNMEGTL
ncbi:MAG: hypothetical protein E7371_03545 [Clostridiales bacterium]|nr:hypothetical protein [Clostridiales bacterium]